MAAKATTGKETFLAACILHTKERINIDFDALAKDLGMSVGGAQNKFRNIMRAIEEEKAAGGAPADTSSISQTPKTSTTQKTSTKRKANVAGKKKKVELEVEDESSLSEAESPMKKVKKIVQTADDSDGGEA